MNSSQLKYHPSQVDAFAEETGYVGFLTEEQDQILKVLFQRVFKLQKKKKKNYGT